MDASHVTDSNNGYLWVCCSFISFLCTNYALGLFVPINAQKTKHHAWKWQNTGASLLHSFITGVWSMFCFYQIPAMKDDLINNYSFSAQAVISLSVGYFIYDLYDMAINDFKRSKELLLHHCLVISCFGLSVCTCYYQGYSLIALLVEVNSVFLHMRQLMLLYGIQKSSSIYQINGILNIGTFVIFRVFTMGWMFHWLLSHRTELSATVFGLGVCSLLVIMGMNFQLLYRVWKSDYRKRVNEQSGKRKESSKSKSLLSHSEKFAKGENFHGNHEDLLVLQNGKVSSPMADGDSVSIDGENMKID